MERLMPLRLYLIRHPETEDNITGRFAGLRDSALTPTGKMQAQATARHLCQANLSAIFTSPSRRALYMAEALLKDVRRCADQYSRPCSEDQVILHTMPELHERSFGEWDGLTFAEAQQLAPQTMQAWIDDPLGTCPPGGESLLQCAQRLQPLAEWFVQSANVEPVPPSPSHYASAVLPKPKGPVAIITHGATLRILLVLLLHLPLDSLLKFGCDHAGISIIDLYGHNQAVLHTLNDTSHLERNSRS